MASLNLSTNGPSITKSYQSVVNSPPASGAAASSGTYGHWALFTVAAPLVSAFQHDGGGKESVLKVQSTGEGELVDLIEDFSDGRIQFAFLKVKDPNTTLPKNVLISWCGEGVPERTKGYFNSHRSAVSKILHGYHVEITARSDRDLTPESIVQKVADASGSKYSGGGSVSSSGGPPPPASSKPVFTPTAISGATSSFNPLGSRSRGPASSGNTDSDGWGADAPELHRTQLEKVAPAYKPTKVNLAELTSQKEPSRYNAPAPSRGSNDVVRGAYQPVGKVDINEIRRKAATSGEGKDDRPTTVKGAYEPVGKVDIAAIRARAQGGLGSSGSPQNLSPAATGQINDDERPKSLSERSGAFQQSERLTSLPKPKIANKFGGGSSFTGTKAPAPGGFSAKTNASAAPVGVASRTFADEGGKTPAQIWAEKKARQGGGVISPATTGEPPIRSQPSGGDGGWKSGYTGKSWSAVQTTHTGKSAGSNLSEQRTGQEQSEEPSPPAGGGVGSTRDRFESNPPPMDMSSKPNAGGARGVPMPGLPSRPSGVPAEHHVNIPSPPPQPRSPSPPTPDERMGSPIRVAMPVSRTKEPEEMEAPEERFSPPPMPTESLSNAASAARGGDDGTARGAGQAAATTTFGAGAASANPGAATSGKRALISYDYEKAEDNELELREGDYVTNIEMVDEDWWMGQNSQGETGLFPSNYVEIVEDEEPARAPAPAPSAPQSAPAPAAAPTSGGKTATAQYDYEAAEDNELSFPDGATIKNIEFPDDDWWFGEYGGKTGLFPANYVELDQ
ncbi:hypothetical protein EJ08DRAFT_645518 [Tothia fuscella]|uniref:Actin binding protein n=1 Tax=Tothia fuscella TaxID=1048955 RepID=A0A9P4P0A9_9PEZI|nr:hypothetical protein EJ08DRAFT_645518 [Tothia fuscella]